MKKMVCFVVILSMVLCSVVIPAFAVSDPVNRNNYLYDVVWSSQKGLFVAVGSNGAILTSPNGTDWTYSPSGVTITLSSVAWSPDLGMFAAVGENGIVIKSTDGKSWQQVNSDTEFALFGVTNKGASFSIVGGAGIMLKFNGTSISPDSFYGSTYCLRGIKYAGNTTVTVGDNGDIFKKGDSESLWTKVTSGTTRDFLDVTNFYGGIFVAVGEYPGVIYASTNYGVSWQPCTLPSGFQQYINGVIGNGSSMIAVGNVGVILKSNGLPTWTSATSSTQIDLNSVAWSTERSLFVAVGDSERIISSPDGNTWTNVR